METEQFKKIYIKIKILEIESALLKRRIDQVWFSPEMPGYFEAKNNFKLRGILNYSIF
jgi:hypothetical protein